MRNIEYSSKFKLDFKLAKKQGKDLNKLRVITEKLVNDEQIPAVNLDHSLKGRWIPYRELHIEPEWLLIYRKFENTIRFERLGAHTDHFG